MTVLTKILAAFFLFAVLPSAGAITAKSLAVGQNGKVQVAFSNVAVPAPRSSPVPYEAGYPSDIDPKERGPFGSTVASRISALTVTWEDRTWLKTDKDAEDLLQELLTNSNTQTWNYHVWSYADSVPALIVTLEHVNGKTGLWVVWAKPNLSWAYQDENDKWWWGIWNVQKSPMPKSLAASP